MVSVVLASAAVSVAPGAPAGREVVLGSATSPSLGVFLVQGGRALYHTSAEKPGKIACVGSCAVTWRPLLLPAGARLAAGAGVRSSLLGTVKRPGGTVQVTYDRLPLYLYSGDRSRGETLGQGLGGLWHVVAPSGAIVTRAITKATSTSSSPSSMGGSSTTTSTTGGASSVGTAGSAGMLCAALPQDCTNGVPNPTGSG